RTRRCWLAEPADWGNVQIARRVARVRTGALSGCGAGDGGSDQRASCHGHGGSNQPVSRISASGKLRVAAVTSPGLVSAAPDLPTVAESGFPGLTNQSTIGPVAPAGTPKPIIEQIAQAVRTALAEPAYQQKLIDSGFEASPDTTPEKFRRRLEADVAFWTPVVEALELRID